VRQPRPILSFTKVLVTNLVLLLGGLALLELGTRYFTDTQPIAVLTGNAPEPQQIPVASPFYVVNEYSKLSHRRNLSVPFDPASDPPTTDKSLWKKTTNSEGFISTPEVPLDKPPGTFRIVFLGGSSTAGTGVILPDSETWPQQTIKRLRELRPQVPIDFINAAVNGQDTKSLFGRFWSRVLNFNPDLVIVNEAWNDMYRFHDYEAGRRDFGDVEGEVYRKMLSSRAMDAYFSWSRLYAFARLRLDPPSGELESAETPLSRKALAWDRRSLTLYRQNIRLFRAVCKEFGIRLGVTKQPTLISPDLPEKYRHQAHLSHHYFTSWNEHVSAFEGVYAAVDEVLERDQVINLTSLNGKPEYFYDHIHPTPLGASKIASLVAEWIASRLPAKAGHVLAGR